jgi:hypothetical protein
MEIKSMKTIEGTIQHDIRCLGVWHYCSGMPFDEGWKECIRDILFAGFACDEDEYYFKAIYTGAYKVEGPVVLSQA